MANSYISLATITLASSASSVTFSSISQNYKDLVLIANYGQTTGSANVRMRLNNDAGANYRAVYLSGGGGSFSSSTATGATEINLNFNATGTATIKDLMVINFMDYSSLDKHKNILSKNGGQYGTEIIGNKWSSTSEINNIRIYPTANAFNAGSTFSLYGIAA